MIKAILFIIGVIFSSCSTVRFEESYFQEYRYLENISKSQKNGIITNLSQLPDTFIVVHVDAPRLHYRNFTTFIESLHNGLFFRRDPQIGHAWITISSIDNNGKRIYYEVSHSGELGLSAPRYFDTVLQLSERGDPNPIRYLHSTLTDGYKEYNGGGHKPSFSALFPISKEHFDNWIDYTFGPDQYDFQRWSLLNHNCLTYVQASLLLCGIEPKLREQNILISQTFSFSGKLYNLWSDPKYSLLKSITVDSLERWLLIAVQSGIARPISGKKLAKWKSFWQDGTSTYRSKSDY